MLKKLKLTIAPKKMLKKLKEKIGQTVKLRTVRTVPTYFSSALFFNGTIKEVTETDIIPRLVQDYGFDYGSQTFLNHTISKHLERKWGALVVDVTTPVRLFLTEEQILNGLKDADIHMAELAIKLGLTKEEVTTATFDYFRSADFTIIRSGIIGTLERTTNNGIRASIYWHVSQGVQNSYRLGLAGKDLLIQQPMLFITVPTLCGLTLRGINLFLPQNGIISNATLLASDICYIPAWILQTGWNSAIASPLTKLGVPFLGMNITGVYGDGWEAGQYLRKNIKLQEKLKKIISEALVSLQDITTTPK